LTTGVVDQVSPDESVIAVTTSVETKVCRPKLTARMRQFPASTGLGRVNLKSLPVRPFCSFEEEATCWTRSVQPPRSPRGVTHLPGSSVHRLHQELVNEDRVGVLSENVPKRSRSIATVESNPVPTAGVVFGSSNVAGVVVLSATAVSERACEVMRP